MKKNNYPTLVISVSTAILLIAIIALIFSVKRNSELNRSSLKNEEQKIKDLNYDITLASSEDVFKAIGKNEYMIIDTRDSNSFSESHIESSINIPLSELVKTNSILDKEKTLIIIEKESTLEGKEVASNLKDDGFKVNYLQGGLVNYLGLGYNLVSFGDVNSTQDRAKVRLETLESLGKKLLDGERFVYLDVRKKIDFEKDHFQNAVNIPLEDLEKDKPNIPTGKILIIDEDSTRSFQAAVRLYDMNILSAYYLTNSYSEFKEAIKNKTLLSE